MRTTVWACAVAAVVLMVTGCTTPPPTGGGGGCLVQPALQQSEAQLVADGTSATVAGTVTLSGAGPVAGALVEFKQSGTTIASATTGAGGNYSVVVPNGTYDVQVQAAGAQPRTLLGIEVVADRELYVVLSSPVGSFSVSGRVVNSDGSPAQFVTVNYSVNGSSNGATSATVDENGEFVLRDVPPGEIGLSIFVSSLGWAPGPGESSTSTAFFATLSMGSDLELGTLTLPPREDVTFEVVDPDGNPIPDAFVGFAFPEIGTEIGDFPQTTLGGLTFFYGDGGSGFITGADGTVTANTPVTDTIYAVASANGYQPPTSYTSYTIGADNTVTITLTPLAENFSLTGRILESTGAAPADGTVTIDGHTATIDPNTGVFTIPQVAAFRDRDLELVIDDGTGGTTTFTRPNLRLETNTDLGTLTLPPRHTLTLNVVDQNNSPVANADINLSSTPHSIQLGDNTFTQTTQHTATTNTTGTHTITTHTHPNLTIGISRDGYQPAASQTVNLTASTTLNLSMNQVFSVSGRVVNSDGSPAQFVTVNYSVNGSSNGATSATVDENGEFVLRDVPPGEIGLSIFVSSLGWAPGPGESSTSTAFFATLSMGSDLELGTLTLPPREDVTFEVVDPDGNPIPDAFVGFAFPEIGTEIGDFPQTTLGGLTFFYGDGGSGFITGADGTVTANTPVTDTIYAVASANGYQPPTSYTSYTIGADNTVTITLTPLAENFSLTGRILESTGAAPADGTVTIDGHTATIDPNTGVFTIPQVAAFRDRDLELVIDDGTGGTTTFTRPNLRLETNTDLGTLTLPPRHTLTLNVVDQNNSPVANADINLSSTPHSIQLGDNTFTQTTQHTATTNTTGSHTITTHTHPNLTIGITATGQGLTLTSALTSDRTITVAILGAPEQVAATALSSSQAMVSWEPPSGVSNIAGYEVTATASTAALRAGSDDPPSLAAATDTADVTVVVGPNDRSTLLSGLRAGTSYTVTVSAITDQGVGAAAVTQVRTTGCATNVRLSPSRSVHHD